MLAPDARRDDGDALLLMRLHLEYFGRDVTNGATLEFSGFAEDAMKYRVGGDGMLVLAYRSREAAATPTVTAISFASEDGPIDLALGNAALPADVWARQRDARCAGDLTLRFNARHAGDVPRERWFTQKIGAGPDAVEWRLPAATEIEYAPTCRAIAARFLGAENSSHPSGSLGALVPTAFRYADPPTRENALKQIIALNNGAGAEHVLRWSPVTIVAESENTCRRGGNESKTVRLLDTVRAETASTTTPVSYDAIVIEESNGIVRIPGHCVRAAQPAGELSGGNPRFESIDDLTIQVMHWCPHDTAMASIAAIVERTPSRRRVVAVCEDSYVVYDFDAEIPVHRQKLGLACASLLDCDGDACRQGICTRRCESNDDCGIASELDLIPALSCAAGTCAAACGINGACPGRAACHDSVCVPRPAGPARAKSVRPAR